MKKLFLALAAVSALSNVYADEISLFDWAFNANGTLYESQLGLNPPSSVLPSYFDYSAFDWNQGLGTISLTYAPSAAGSYYMLSYFDLEIDQNLNTYFNEYGETGGTVDPNLMWEIDEPGFVYGDIYQHLANYNGISDGFDNTVGAASNQPDDVSMGMGWNFALSDGQYAVMDFSVTRTAPIDGFYLAQVDPESQTTAYFTSTLRVLGGGVVTVPEPSSFSLLFLGLPLLLAGSRLRRHGK